MAKTIHTSWDIPFTPEQKELADKLLSKLNESQVALLDGYFNGSAVAAKKLSNLLEAAKNATGGSQEPKNETDKAIWSLNLLKTIAQEDMPEYGRNKPFYAPVITRKSLNGSQSSKETHHIELSLKGSGLNYEPGDACGIFGHNTDRLVSGVLQLTQLDPNYFVEVEKGFISLREALTHHLELSNLQTNVLRDYNKLANSSKLTNLLANATQVKEYLAGRDVLDMLTDFEAKYTAEELVNVLKKMRPRLYSIASSERVHPEEVHLTVGAVRYNAHGRDKEGTCSTYLADRIFDNSRVPIFLLKNKSFRVPKNTQTPIIMVGAGTGIAPFRAFIEERVSQKATGNNLLIFGNPHKATDYLYSNEWRTYEAKSQVEIVTAFSRDQAEKIYVQQRIVEQGEKIYKLLQKGAQIFICGSRSNLGQSVRDSFAQVLINHGGLDNSAAKAKILSMKKEKLYHEDIY